MCGICGFLSINGSVNSLSAASKMLNSLQHRGPDESGQWTNGNLTLAACRLSIIDIESGSQPKSSNDGRLTIVFNGEIYNYKELKNSYCTSYNFKTSSDTEVLLPLYERFGTDMLRYLNGMFAFCIYDSNKNILFLARDRAGKKPLYYRSTHESFAFASELKAFKHIMSRPVIDGKSLWHFLLFDNVPDPATIYSGIYRLPAGHYLIYNMADNSFKIKRYWKVEFAHSISAGLQRTAAHLDFLLEQSVRYRLISDVPLGLFLSGGLDSTTVLYYASKNRHEPLSTFSIGFENGSYDESGYAHEAASWFNTNHRAMIVSEDELSKDFDELTRFIDEPFADYSMIPTYTVSKFARRYVKTVLSGDGGDELLNGYPTFKSFPLWRLLRCAPSGFTSYLSSVPAPNRAGTYYPIAQRVKQLLRCSLHSRKIYNQILINAYDPAEAAAILGNRYSGPIPDDLDHNQRDNSLISQFYFDYYLRSVLYKVDRASMYASLEVRSPFLDPKLLDIIPQVWWGYKSGIFRDKIMLKYLLKDKIPPRILKRKKHGFALPIASWLRGKWSGLLKQYLSGDSIRPHGLFNVKCVESLVHEHVTSRQDNSKKLWNLLMFQIWFHRFHSGWNHVDEQKSPAFLFSPEA